MMHENEELMKSYAAIKNYVGYLVVNSALDREIALVMGNRVIAILEGATVEEAEKKFPTPEEAVVSEHHPEQGVSKHHPEQGVDEIYLGNFTNESYTQVSWKTKRRGKIAYDINGNILSELRPAFVLRQELQIAYNNGVSSLRDVLNAGKIP
jgi:hypothetical protein